ncbi:MAG: aminotransferase class I/II-fold pyridoxal phosphate-dependent enzyme [Silicimonas sp.]|jgi:dTDP-4-amino-4,6-dideoxygalactose transaminase|nr:aminotransferase class I/II-fold pyridoxal phosphate-dependent enzyme [Silicimonas sp.]
MRFNGNFTQQEPIPEDGIAAATAVMQHGRLHRYNTRDGEAGETAQLEAEFAAFTGARHALAVTSGGYALGTALRALEVKPGEPVLTNAFTLAPVPGAIAALGARPVFVEITEALVIDLDDLAAKAATSGARVLMLSHMRGHQPDMAALMQVAEAAGLTVVEDCAHTMGGSSGGVVSGRHGTIACYSTQTYKHLNSGEGGFLITDDPDIAARATLLSGSYMLYARHGAGPDTAVFEPHRDHTPNVSGRMDNLRAAILRPQLRLLPERVARWAALHDAMEDGLRHANSIHLIQRDPGLVRVGSSFQFAMPERRAEWIADFVSRCAARGVELKWFGAPRAAGFTSTHHHWAYAGSASLPRTDRVLAGLIDMRLPLTFSTGDCEIISTIILEEAASA